MVPMVKYQDQKIMPEPEMHPVHEIFGPPRSFELGEQTGIEGRSVGAQDYVFPIVWARFHLR